MTLPKFTRRSALTPFLLAALACGGKNEGTNDDRMPMDPFQVVQPSCAGAEVGSFRAVAEGVSRAKLGPCGDVAYTTAEGLYIADRKLAVRRVGEATAQMEFSPLGRYLLALRDNHTTSVPVRETNIASHDFAIDLRGTSPLTMVAGSDGSEYLLGCDLEQGARAFDLMTGETHILSTEPCHAVSGLYARAAALVGKGTSRALVTFEASQHAVARVELPLFPDDPAWSQFLTVTAKGQVAIVINQHQVASGDVISTDQTRTDYVDMVGAKALALDSTLGLEFGTPFSTLLASGAEGGERKLFIASSKSLSGPVLGRSRGLLVQDGRFQFIVERGSSLYLLDEGGGETFLLDHRFDVRSSDDDRGLAVIAKDTVGVEGKVFVYQGGSMKEITAAKPYESIAGVTSAGLVVLGAGKSGSRLLSPAGNELATFVDPPFVASAGERALVTSSSTAGYETLVYSKDGGSTKLATSATRLVPSFRGGVTMLMTTTDPNDAGGSEPLANKTLYAGALP